VLIFQSLQQFFYFASPFVVMAMTENEQGNAIGGLEFHG
jgi:hypothetical protein